MSDESKLNFAWIDNHERIGEMLFAFDIVNVFILFSDDLHKLTEQQSNCLIKSTRLGQDFSKIENNINV